MGGETGGGEGRRGWRKVGGGGDRGKEGGVRQKVGWSLEAESVGRGGEVTREGERGVVRGSWSGV